MRAKLSVRMFASYLVVVAVGAATAYVTVRLLVPPLFDHRMSGSMMGGQHGASSNAVHAALGGALNAALVVAVVASAATGAAVAAFVTHRLLRPLTHVRVAARRIAAGDYDSSVPVPREPELAELARDVNTLATSLQATETRRTRLLGDVAHEMRTPLTALDGYVEAFVDGVFAPTTEHLSAMSDELRRLHRLADDLSTLSRTEEGRIDVQLADADLGVVTRGVCDRLRPQFDDARVSLRVGGRQPVPVRIDIDRIGQVLANVLGNALIATPRNGSVTVTVSTTAGSASVEVRDTGVGLAAADRERVFERFYRAATAIRRSGGSGVGLTIARGIARAHGGDLRADSAGPGRGTTVTLTLPRAATASSPSERGRVDDRLDRDEHGHDHNQPGEPATRPL